MRSSCVALSKIELIQAHKEDDTKRKKVRAMNKMTVAAAAAAPTVWRFEVTDGDGKQGGYAVGKSANKTPKTGDTTVLTLPGGEKMRAAG